MQYGLSLSFIIYYREKTAENIQISQIHCYLFDGNSIESGFSTEEVCPKLIF